MNQDNKEFMKNAEGYPDPTQYDALTAVQKLEKEAEHKNWLLMWIIRNACEAADFTLVGRVTLRDNKTGRVFK